jgi:hypothetical protein
VSTARLSLQLPHRRSSYAYSAYGPQGVSRAIQILKDEMEMDLRLIGAPTLKDVTRNMIDTTQLSNRGIESQPDFLYRHNVSLREEPRDGCLPSVTVRAFAASYHGRRHCGQDEAVIALYFVACYAVPLATSRHCCSSPVTAMTVMPFFCSLSTPLQTTKSPGSCTPR